MVVVEFWAVPAEEGLAVVDWAKEAATRAGEVLAVGNSVWVVIVRVVGEAAVAETAAGGVATVARAGTAAATAATVGRAEVEARGTARDGAAARAARAAAQAAPAAAGSSAGWFRRRPLSRVAIKRVSIRPA